MDPNTLALIAALALLAYAGHTLHTIGAVRARNVASVAAASLVGFASLLLLAYALGCALRWMYAEPTPGGARFDSMSETASRGPVVGPAVFFTSSTSFLSILPLGLLPLALCVAATAERARIRAVVLVSAALSIIVLPVATTVGWSIITKLDQPRPDGSYGSAASLTAVIRVWPAIVAHLVAAGAALALAKLIGPRTGKYNRDGSANFIPAHALPTMVLGDLLLLIGIPLVAAAIAGDLAPRFVNALLAASAAGLSAVVLDFRRHGRIDAAGPWVAVLAGTIAGSLSGPAEPLMAIVLGAIVGGLAPLLSLKADLKLRIDEPTGLALAHLLGGIAGAIGATLGGALEGETHFVELVLLGSISFSAAVVVALVGAIVAAAVALAMKQAKLLRVDEAAEFEGLDLARHDINAYPDFQQTLIKSYHLRQ